MWGKLDCIEINREAFLLFNVPSLHIHGMDNVIEKVLYCAMQANSPKNFELLPPKCLESLTNCFTVES